MQTLEGMNQGMTIEQLVEKVKLPENLANLFYLGEHYGSVEWTVRSIFNAYVGWFDGNPTSLHPLAASQYAAKTIRMMGGSSNVLQEIHNAVESKEYQWGMQLCDLLLNLAAAQEVEIAQAKKYKAQCCLGIADLETSSNGRHYYQMYAKELMK